MTAQKWVAEPATAVAAGGERSRRRWLGAAAVIALGTLMWMLLYNGPGTHVSADTLQYAYQTRLLMGDDRDQAYETAAAWYCDRPDAMSSAGLVTHKECLQQMAAADAKPHRIPEFQHLFHGRLLWSILAAPLVTLIGLDALVVVTLLGGIALAAACYWAVRELGGNHWAGLASIVLVYVLPSGKWATYIIPEGLVLALTAVTVIGAIRLVDGRRWGAALFAVGLTATALTKSANAVAAAVFISAAAAVLFLFRSAEVRKRLAVLVAIAAAVTLGWFVFAKVMGYSGLDETLQDLATAHFMRPARQEPWPLLWQLNIKYGLPFLRELLTDPWWLVLLVVAGWQLARRSGTAAWLWLAVGLSGIMVSVAHPSVSNWPRLLIPVWLPVAVGWALLVSSGSPDRLAQDPEKQLA